MNNLDFKKINLLQDKINNELKLRIRGICDEYSNKFFDKVKETIKVNAYIEYDGNNEHRYYKLTSLKFDGADEYGRMQLRIVCKKVLKNMKLGSRENWLSPGMIKGYVDYSYLENIYGHARKTKKYIDKYLYFFQHETGYIKIGQAINIESRKKSIEMQSGVDITVLNSIQNGAKYERVLHKLFKEYIHKGEWFNLDKEKIDWIKNLNELNIDFEIDFLKK